jgi:hypothetical protein
MARGEGKRERSARPPAHTTHKQNYTLNHAEEHHREEQCTSSERARHDAHTRGGDSTHRALRRRRRDPTTSRGAHTSMPRHRVHRAHLAAVVTRVRSGGALGWSARCLASRRVGGLLQRRAEQRRGDTHTSANCTPHASRSRRQHARSAHLSLARVLGVTRCVVCPSAARRRYARRGGVHTRRPRSKSLGVSAISAARRTLGDARLDHCGGVRAFLSCGRAAGAPRGAHTRGRGTRRTYTRTCIRRSMD